MLLYHKRFIEWRRRWTKHSALVFAFALLLPGTPGESYAIAPAGQAGAFLRMGLGARALAMGNAFTAVGADGFSGYYNAASLPFMHRPELAFQLSFLPLDRTLGYVGYSTYLHPRALASKGHSEADEKGLRAGFAVGWIYGGITNIDLRDSDGNHLKMTSSDENAFFFSFSLRPLRTLAFGLTAKVVNHQLPGLQDDGGTLSASGFGYDLSLYWRPLNSLSIAAVIRDINTKYTWNTERLWERGSTTVNRFPTLLRLGMAWTFWRQVLFAADAEFNKEQGWRFYTGAEMPVHSQFIARLGYNADRFTFGFGVQFAFWKYRAELSYAYDTQGITPRPEQHFSWRIFL
jgi:hypothetical protein